MRCTLSSRYSAQQRTLRLMRDFSHSTADRHMVPPYQPATRHLTGFLHCFKRASTHEPLVDEVELIDVSPTYAHIRHRYGAPFVKILYLTDLAQTAISVRI